MDEDFFIFRIFKRISDFTYFVGWIPDPPDQLTFNIYKIKKLSHLSYISLTLSLLSSFSYFFPLPHSSLLPTSISLSLSHFLFSFTKRNLCCESPLPTWFDLHRHTSRRAPPPHRGPITSSSTAKSLIAT